MTSYRELGACQRVLERWIVGAEGTYMALGEKTFCAARAGSARCLNMFERRQSPLQEMRRFAENLLYDLGERDGARVNQALFQPGRTARARWWRRQSA